MNKKEFFPIVFGSLLYFCDKENINFVNIVSGKEDVCLLDESEINFIFEERSETEKEKDKEKEKEGEEKEKEGEGEEEEEEDPLRKVLKSLGNEGMEEKTKDISDGFKYFVQCFCASDCWESAVDLPIEFYSALYYSTQNNTLTYCKDSIKTIILSRLNFNYKNTKIPILFPLTTCPVERTFSFWRRMMDRNKQTRPILLFAILFCKQFSFKYIKTCLKCVKYSQNIHSFIQFLMTEYKSKQKNFQELSNSIKKTNQEKHKESKARLFKYLRETLGIFSENEKWVRNCSIEFCKIFHIDISPSDKASKLEDMIYKLVWIGFIHYLKDEFISELSRIIESQEGKALINHYLK